MRAFSAVVSLLAGLLLLAASPGQSPNVGAQEPPRQAGQRALVLGGGGATGQAWEIGLLRGLRDAGVDLTEADLIAGTSAGAILGARLRAGRSLDELYEGLSAPPAPGTGLDLSGVDLPYFQETARMWSGIDTTPALRIDVGRRALAATRVISEDAWVQRWTTALGDPGWGSQPLVITAMDVLDGSTRLVDGTQGVPVARAVAASTALPGMIAPITIGDRRFMDGGLGGTHLDAAAGYGIVVGVTLRAATAREMGDLRVGGSQVTNVVPDAESAAARGTDCLDRTRLPGTAEAGYRQAAAVAADLHGLWSGASASR
ncbi:MAG TPA: patatin-like phospholipase family protein [Chloroflexota bacterium]|jgi:NTE family protein